LVKQPLDFLMVTGELFLSYKGPGSDREILDLVKQITPTPASTVLTAVTRGCRALGLKRVVMASPFPEDQDERLVKFLAHDGIEVVAFRGLGCPNAEVIWQLAPETGYDLSMALLREHPEVDGVYMPCNKWRTVSVIERIEKDSGKPVVTNTQAWTWEALHGMGLREPITGFGRLLRQHYEDDCKLPLALRGSKARLSSVFKDSKFNVRWGGGLSVQAAHGCT
jgi:maleate cis-trans isomerase